MRLVRLAIGAFCALAMVLTMAACNRKSAEDYVKESYALRAANDVAGAERVLQEGLHALPGNDRLIGALLLLYRQSNQWDKLEAYVSIVSSNNVADMASAYENLGEHYFDEKDWAKASKYYTQGADTWAEVGTCGALLGEDYRNVAAANSNMRNKSGVILALNSLEALAARCQSKSGPATMQAIQSDIQEVRNIVLKL